MVRDEGISQNPPRAEKGKAMTGTASIETGHFAEFASAIIQQLPRDIDSTTAQGWIENRAALRKVLRTALLPNTQSIGPTYPVTVNYGLSLEEMIAAGRYNWKNGDITAEHFPMNGDGTKEVVTELIHFNNYTESDKALRELDRRGFRPATIEELLAFGAKYPELQRQFPIVALGSIWRHLSDRYVPYLWSFTSGRYLRLYWFGVRWSVYYRFLAVRK